MSRLKTTLIGSLVMAAALTSPNLAQAAPVGIWVDLHYANWPDQPAKTLTYKFQLASLDKVNTLCTSETNLMRLATHIQRGSAFLNHETIFGASCQMDRSGKIKTAAGSSLAGSK